MTAFRNEDSFRNACAFRSQIRLRLYRKRGLAALRVVSRIRQSIGRLAILPLSGGRGAVEGTRLLAVPNLPYIVVYRVSEATVDILAVLHTAMKRRD